MKKLQRIYDWPTLRRVILSLPHQSVSWTSSLENKHRQLASGPLQSSRPPYSGQCRSS
jgi:hypothetical protein